MKFILSECTYLNRTPENSCNIETSSKDTYWIKPPENYSNILFRFISYKENVVNPVNRFTTHIEIRNNRKFCSRRNTWRILKDFIIHFYNKWINDVPPLYWLSNWVNCWIIVKLIRLLLLQKCFFCPLVVFHLLRSHLCLGRWRRRWHLHFGSGRRPFLENLKNTSHRM